MDAIEEKTVLVVDDNRIVCAAMRAALRDAGLRAELRYDADSAMEFLKGSSSTALILLDWILPGPSGLQFLKDVKLQAAYRLLPVIMITGRSEDADIREGIEAGALYYLTKPFEPGTLMALVHAALSDFPPVSSDNRAPQHTFSLPFSAEFRFRTMEDATSLASTLSLACSDPASARLGLHELLINAVEHGNLEITHAQKTTLLKHRALRDEISSRLRDPKFKDRFATVTAAAGTNTITIVIRDSGPGFDYEPYLRLSPARAFSEHGRGIAIARQFAFETIEFTPPGNVVTATIARSKFRSEGNQ